MKNAIIVFIMLFALTAPIWAQAASDFNVTLTSDGTGVVITKYIGSVLQVRIPSTIEGLPVREIRGFAFESKRNITSVVIPEGVTIIGDYAFSNCGRLTSITLPNTLLIIGRQAFSSCSALRTITLPANLTYIGEGAFSSSDITSFTWPAGIQVIPKAVFHECRNLKTVIIPEGVTEIGDGAFYNCSALESIIIPETVTNIKFFREMDIFQGSFYGCGKLSLASQAALRRLGYKGSF